MPRLLPRTNGKLVEISKGDLEVLYSKRALDERIDELGKQIAADYKDKDLHVIAVLKGSFMFLADLVRAIDHDHLSVDFLGLSSYGNRTQSSGVVRMTQDLSVPIEGKHVLVVEDIIDTGLTMQYLLENLKTRRPASVEICTLLSKPDNSEVHVDMKYIGFTIPNKFVIGYGLDYAERFRNLPYIGVVRTD